MPMNARRTPKLLLVIAVSLTAMLLLGLMLPAFGATPTERIKSWWQYDPKMWRDGFPAHTRLRNDHDDWHQRHRDATKKRHESFHDELMRAHRQMHFHKAVDKESGQATWYDGDGAPGACGDGLKGIYIAHKTWPCGTLVSIRSHGKYVLARVRDRGPYGEGRVVDLSPKAFKALAALSVGVIDVRITRLKG